MTAIGLLHSVGLSTSLVSASLDRVVRIWDAATGKSLESFTLPSPVHDITVGAGGAEVFTACGNGELRGLSLNSGKETGSRRFVGHAGAVTGCSLNLDNSVLASCSVADRVMLWDTRTQQCLSRLHGNKDVTIGAVQIMQRMAVEHQLPAFQPLQRIITEPKDLPPTPLYIHGGSSTLRRKVLAQIDAEEDFVERTIFGGAEGLEAWAKCNALETQAKDAKAVGQRWAAAASELWEHLHNNDSSGTNDPKASGEITSKAKNPSSAKRPRKSKPSQG